MLIPLHHFLFAVAGAGQGAHRLTVFFSQVLLLILVGRLLGEVMQRFKQPAVVGQLLAGIVLGPSVFGALWPAAQTAIFPVASADRQMLTAVSELGVLMLLLLTGMETDLALVKRVRGTAAITSLAGIVLPFFCGYVLGELLPQNIVPDPSRRMATSLFLAAALSISSVKIVAVVLGEMDFLRRSLGQIILASAILDDTICWILLALIGGLAAQGKIAVGPLLGSVAGTIAFLIVCFTVGRRWVARLIRWTNDHFTIEMPVISAILVIMMALALLTDAIGVHTVLGAFMAGLMIGQSPILTRHIEEELRGLIVALFMPVFFGVAGLSIDLRVLSDPQLLGFTFLLIAIASVGKLGGCYLGSRLARMSHTEALSVGFAMNARGSTEVILATIGLSIGVLDQRLFTMIVLMAVVTTLCMPPLLRWALVRVPMRPEEKERMEAEAAEIHDLLPKLERVLVAVDASATGTITSQLAGWLIGARGVTATVYDFGAAANTPKSPSTQARNVSAAAETAARAVEKENKARQIEKGVKDSNPVETAAKAAKSERQRVSDLISVLSPDKALKAGKGERADAVLAEAKNGYNLLLIGLETGAEAEVSKFPGGLDKILRQFAGPTAILFHAAKWAPRPTDQLESILVPTTRTTYSRFGAEMAVAIAKGCDATITALHISASPTEHNLQRSRQLLRTGRAILSDIAALGRREAVLVLPKLLVRSDKEGAILREAAAGGYQLIVIGARAAMGEEVHFNESAEAILANAPCPVLLLKS